MLVREEESLHKQPETVGRNNGDAEASGSRSRKRPRVDEESSSTALNSKGPSPAKQSIQIEGSTPQIHSTLPEMSASISQADDSSASHQSDDGNMESRISELQKEITKLQQDLHDKEAQNAQATSKNEQLELKVEVLTETNKELREELYERMGTKEKTEGSPRVMHESTEPSGKNTVGHFAEPPSNGSGAGASKADGQLADLRTRLEGHANNFKSIVDDVIDTQNSLQGALKTIADQKCHNAKLSAEIKTLQDAHTQLETEHREEAKRLQALQAWLKGVPKSDQ